METNMIKRLDLELHLVLPANAPTGHPHIIDFSNIDEEGPTDNLHAVDSIATTLYKWNPEALQALLNLGIQNFHWGHIHHQGFEHYVRRTGREVRIGSLEIRKGVPDYEIQYFILDDGCWQITGGREDALHGHMKFLLEDRPERCSTYDHMFAMSLIIHQMWVSDDLNYFRFEVNGQNILDHSNGPPKKDITQIGITAKSEEGIQKTGADHRLRFSRSPSLIPESPKDIHVLSKKHEHTDSERHSSAPEAKKHKMDTASESDPGSPTPIASQIPKTEDALEDDVYFPSASMTKSEPTGTASTTGVFDTTSPYFSIDRSHPVFNVRDEYPQQKQRAASETAYLCKKEEHHITSDMYATDISSLKKPADSLDGTDAILSHDNAISVDKSTVDDMKVLLVDIYEKLNGMDKMVQENLTKSSLMNDMLRKERLNLRDFAVALVDDMVELDG